MKKKTVALLLALVLVFGVAAGGTLAWLTAQTSAVTNTFTVGDINITLTETGTVNGNKSFQLIPGTEYSKDPKVSVTGNVDCYLFVRFDEINNPAAYLNYTSTLTAGNGWTQGDNENRLPENVWYREVGANDDVKEWELLANNKVTVKETVVKTGTDIAGTSNVAMPSAESQPVLKYQAAAVQKDNRTLEQAFGLVKADLGFVTP